jgi:hypothetical protein
MVDDDDAAEARVWWPARLRTMPEVSEQAPDPETRAYAWRSLQKALVMLRSVIEQTASAEVRQDATEALRAF